MRVRCREERWELEDFAILAVFGLSKFQISMFRKQKCFRILQTQTEKIHSNMNRVLVGLWGLSCWLNIMSNSIEHIEPTWMSILRSASWRLPKQTRHTASDHRTAKQIRKSFTRVREIQIQRFSRRDGNELKRNWEIHVNFSRVRRGELFFLFALKVETYSGSSLVSRTFSFSNHIKEIPNWNRRTSAAVPAVNER